MSGLSRRRLLQGSAAVAGGAVLGAGPFQNYIAHAAAPRKVGHRPADYGALVAVPDQRGNGVTRLSLPEGFNYRSFHMAGSPLGDDAGTLTPPRSDGMAAFLAARAPTCSCATTRSTVPVSPSAIRRWPTTRPRSEVRPPCGSPRTARCAAPRCR